MSVRQQKELSSRNEGLRDYLFWISRRWPEGVLLRSKEIKNWLRTPGALWAHLGMKPQRKAVGSL